MIIASLFLNEEIRTGGHRRLLELLEELTEKGSIVYSVINDRLDYQPRHFIPIRIRCRYRRKGLIPISQAFYAAIRFSLKRISEELQGSDILMIHGETHLKAAYFMKRKLGIPLLYAHRSNTVRETLASLSDSDITLLDRIRLHLDLFKYSRYEKKITAYADSIVFQSPFDLDDFVTRNPTARVKAKVIRGNIGLPRFQQENENTNTSKVLRKIVFVGTLGSRKGVRHLLAAMIMLRERGHSELTLDVIGPGDSMEYWRDWVRQNGLEDRVTLHGRVIDPFPYISGSDLMVVPSDFDSYPDTVLESLHAGTPVIGSAAGGIPDILEYPELIFNVQSPAEIADKIEALVSDPNVYNRAKKLCLIRQRAFHFDWAAEWEKVMLETVSDGVIEKAR